MLITSSHKLSLILTLLLAAMLATACGAPAGGTAELAALPPAVALEAAAPADAASSIDELLTPAAEATQGGNEPAAEASLDQPAEATTEAASGGAEDGRMVGFTDEGRPYRGSLDAPVVMEEFSDFQCPYCGRFTSQVLDELLADEIANGELLLIYYDFPLESIHPQATAAANAARCAGETGAEAYWAMHDLLFADMQVWSGAGAEAAFRQFGEEIGLDAAAFSACLGEERYYEQIQADVDLGRSRGVSSTPSFFLNDQILVGAYPLDVFRQAIADVKNGESIAAAPTAVPQPAIKPTPATIVMADTVASLGDPSAPVTIVEYTDYQCPYCARHSAQTLPTLISDMIDSGRVQYIVKDFPLDSIHPEARQAAVAARCAAEQDAYWPMHDQLFATQGEWGGLGDAASDLFLSYAESLSLDTAAFAICAESGRHDDVIQANLDEGLALGVRGTPAFFIDGFPISGAQPYEVFEYAVGLAEEGTLADAYVAPEAEAPPPTPSGPVEVATDEAYAAGDPAAPVTIVEFTDFQCPYCSRHFAQTYPQIKADYIDAGLVYYVFKDFPLTSIHPQATLAAVAARCAGDQGDYLGMHQRLFSGQGEWSGRRDAGFVFAAYAGELGLDQAVFTECLESNVYEEAVMADLDEGISLGITGTPGFFINGHYLSGAQPYAVFQQAIDQLLAAGE